MDVRYPNNLKAFINWKVCLSASPTPFQKGEMI